MLSLTHPLSLAGFRVGHADCLEEELMQFMLGGIEQGIRLGPLEAWSLITAAMGKGFWAAKMNCKGS